MPSLSPSTVTDKLGSVSALLLTQTFLLLFPFLFCSRSLSLPFLLRIIRRMPLAPSSRCRLPNGHINMTAFDRLAAIVGAFTRHMNQVNQTLPDVGEYAMLCRFMQSCKLLNETGKPYPPSLRACLFNLVPVGSGGSWGRPVQPGGFHCNSFSNFDVVTRAMPRQTGASLALSLRLRRYDGVVVCAP